MAKRQNPLMPDTSLLCRLGSIVTHAEEMLSPDGHAFDRTALEALLNDEEVQAWMHELGRMALLPVKRKPAPRPKPNAESGASTDRSEK